MKAKIYVSGASREVERVRGWVAALTRSALFEFVDPWWAGAEQWSGRDQLTPRSEQARIAARHQRAIRESHILWVLWPQTHSYGAHVELGYALACVDLLGTLAPVVCVTGLGCNNSVFTGGVVYRDPVDALGLDFVCRIAREKIAKRAKVSP